MRYWKLYPEVAGGFGANTVFTRVPGKPLIVHKLHYEFSGWSGDDLLTSTPCYIVTDRLARAIKDASLTGVEFDNVEITTSDLFEELYPGRKLPPFIWLKVIGEPGKDDFGLDQLDLVVSDRTLQLLKSMQLKNCDILEFVNRHRENI
jgi:hypothetical protein